MTRSSSPTVRGNIAANLAGKVVAAAVGLIFPPVYARLLGIESYGLVGFFASLTAVLTVLDLGLSATMQRELALLSGKDSVEADRIGSIVRTFEGVFWAIGLASAAVVVLTAPVIADRWLHPNHLQRGVVTQAIRLMGVAMALQWPAGLYSGGVQATQRQLALNGFQSVLAFLKWAGGALVLWKVSATISALLGWLAFVALAQTLSFRWLLHRVLPAARGGKFALSALRGTWRLSAGLWAISLLALVLTQVDKFVVSRVLTLEDLGYYTLAGTVGSGLYYLVYPVASAIFPRLCQLMGAADRPALAALYHRSSRVMSAIVMPLAVVVVLFSREVMLAWTGSPTTVSRTSLVVSVLVAGTAINGIMHVPYSLQIAAGWTRLAIWMNGVAVLVLTPAVYLMGKRFGAAGVAGGWLGLNVAYLVVGIQLMHRRLLRGEMARWYLLDIGLPFMAAVAAALPIRLMVTSASVTTRLGAFAALSLAATVAYAAAALSTPELRAAARGSLQWIARYR